MEYHGLYSLSFRRCESLGKTGWDHVGAPKAMSFDGHVCRFSIQQRLHYMIVKMAMKFLSIFLLSFLLLLLTGQVNGACTLPFQIVLYRWDSPNCYGLSMDHVKGGPGVELAMNECRSSREGKKFMSFASSWLPHHAGSKRECHGQCNLTIYEVDKCAGRSKKRIPETEPILVLKDVCNDWSHARLPADMI